MLQRIINYQKNHELLSAFIIIFVCVLAFNYEAIFGLKTLRLDDFARYFDAINGYIYRPDAYSTFGAVFKALNKWLMLIDIHFARLFYTLVFVIPLSLIIFYFNRLYFRVEFLPALTAAIIINILPFQIDIPKFLDGSYPVRGLIFMFLTLVYILEYLKTKRLLYLPLILIFWVLTNMSYTEMGIFLLIPILILIYFYEGSLKTKLHAMVLILSVGFYELYKTLFVKSRAAAEVTSHSSAVITDRFAKFIEWSSIIPRSIRSLDLGIWHLIITLSMFILICAGCVLLYKKGNYKFKVKAKSFYLFYTSILIFGAIPFLFISPFFEIRYFFLSYMALYVLVVYSIYAIFLKLFANKLFIIVIMALLIIFTGTHRHFNQIQVNERQNNRYYEICGEINNLDEIKPNAQLVITNYNVGTGEHFMWSSGYIAHCLERAGIIGIIGNEYFFYDPFQYSDRAYHKKMGGLDLERPIYSIHYENGQPVNRKYFLRWLTPDNNESEWLLYKRDEHTHILKEYAIGVGIDNYIHSLEGLNLSSDVVLWGSIKGGLSDPFYQSE